MYQIGLFSKIHRVSTKTLRHYDRIGLLKPALIDQETGYRFYTSRQIPKLNRILSLKQMGFSLAEIQEVVDKPDGLDVLLNVKARQLEQQADALDQQIKQVRYFQQHLAEGNSMEYSPVVKELPEVTVASMRFVADSYDTFFDVIPKMGEEMRRQKAKVASPPYCFNIYHDGEYKASDIDVETCEAVVAPKKDSEKVKYKILSGEESAACVLHKGPYSSLRNAYGFLFGWISDNGYEVSGLPRESYIDGVWNKDDENEWLTEIQIPVNPSVSATLES